MEMQDTSFEPQINSSLSNISNESLEIDFCSISIPLELNQSDDSLMEFFFEKEEDMSNLFSSVSEVTKDESEEINTPKLTIKNMDPLILTSSTTYNNNINTATVIQAKPTIIHKPVPVRRNKGLYCRYKK